MNGAVQGDAITTASTPDNAASTYGLRADQLPADDGTSEVNSKTPDRFSARTKKSTASAATTPGDCSWNPQPSPSPAARSAISTPASATKVATTPIANATPCNRSTRRS